MKTPLIFITYGFTNKICTFEEDGTHKMPIFSKPELSSLFIKDFKRQMGDMLDDKDQLEMQICDNKKYMSDILHMISIVDPNIIIVYNPLPIGDISEVEELKYDAENKSYALHEIIEIFDQE